MHCLPVRPRRARHHPASTNCWSAARSRTPEHRLVSIENVGNLATFLVGDGAAAPTDNIEYVDAGYHIVS